MEYRAILEVVKWVAPQYVLRSCSEVSTSWQKPCSSAELWISFLEDSGFDPPSLPPHPSSKQLYSQTCSSLVLILPSRLHLYFPRADTWKEVMLTTEVTVDKSSAWAVDGEGGWVCCGGGAGTNSSHDESSSFNCAYHISRLGGVHPLPNMATARKWHGMVVYTGVCYVFGGVGPDDSDIPLCERMRMKGEERWEKIRPMISARSSFNPCLYADLIYLMLGKTQQSEVFNPLTGLFSPLLLTLANDHSTMVVSKGQLILLTCSICYTASSISALSGNLKERTYCYAWGNMNSTVYDGMVYTPQSYNNRAILRIDLNTLEWTSLQPRETD